MGPRLDIKAHLERVSRSFAFCIARLEVPLRDQVGLSYLLCRILDTVEDANWTNSDAQIAAFTNFIALLKSGGDAKSWTENLISQTSSVSENERILVLEAPLVFERLMTFPLEVRDVILPPVVSMAQGMREFAMSRTISRGLLQLRTLEEVNRYCFFVAGVVGEILDGLLRVEAKHHEVSVHTRLSDGFRFGLFLQKVNLLKDRETDLKESRDLVPTKSDVFQSALEDVILAFGYVSSIPVQFQGYRLFCAWSLFLGLASLPHIARGEKIGRLETLSLLAKVEIKIDSPMLLANFFNETLVIARKSAGAYDAVSSVSAAHEAPPSPTPFLEVPLREVALKDNESRRIALYRVSYVGSARDEDLEEGTRFLFQPSTV